MKNVISNYCKDEQTKNGLILLDMPTGSGKTYSVLDFIYEYIISGGTKRIFFITTLLKNLPEKDLRKKFEESGNLDLFNEKFLRIESNVDSVCHFFQSDDETIEKHRRNIPKEIKQSDEFRAIKDDAEFINKFSSNKSDEADNRKYINKIKAEMPQHSEKSFRSYLEKKISDQFKTVESRKDAIKNNEKWKWVGDMYPAVFTEEKQIIFLSINKFLARNNTIIESSYLFYTNDIIKDSFIFIDEYDSTKDTILNNIIETGIIEKIDTLELFKDIYNALNSDIRTFPSVLIKESKHNLDRKDRGELSQELTPKGIIESFQKKAKKIFDDYSFSLSFKTKKIKDDNKRQFLFHDYRFHSILGNSATIEKNDRDKLNYIEFEQQSKDQNTKDQNKNSVNVMLGQVRGFLSYFQTGIKILALNYQHYKEENKNDNEDSFTYEFAIKSVLHEFQLKDSQIEYLTVSILNGTKSPVSTSSTYDLSFFEKGFRLYDFIDDSTHDMQSVIRMENFQDTPEKILLRICEKAKVIGISATATIPSIIGNFDLNYLKRHLRNNFHFINDEQRATLKKQFEEATINYNKIKINALRVDPGKNNDKVYYAKTWEEVVDDGELARELYDYLCVHINAKDDFIINRYYRILFAYSFFLKHNDAKSFLCVLSKYPKKRDDSLDEDILEELFNKIKQYYKNKYDEVKYVILTSDNFDNLKKDICDRLFNGEKLFVISTYQAIGSGQNLQYTIPHNLRNSLVKINNFDARQEKDFDGIYLDNPTNLIVNLENDIDESDFAKYLFQIEYLQEGAEISSQTALEHIKFAFQRYTSHSQPFRRPKKLSDKKSVNLLRTRIIVQAIGRICRTNMKNKNIYILVDNDILSKIDKTFFDNHLCNKEFEKVLELVNTEYKDENEVSLEEKNNLNADRVYMHINNMLMGDWNKEKMKQWEKLRNFVLIHPTISIDSKLDANVVSIVENMYSKLPSKASELYYLEKEDYHCVKTSFTKNDNYPHEVSENEARLDMLMKVKDLKQYFISKNYATEFVPNDYILSPVLFNNIYKGALGEEVGYWNLQKIGLHLEKIQDEEIYELFDFKLNDKPVFFDMKHWKESTFFDVDKMYEKIKTKLAKCNGKIAVFINLLSENYYSSDFIFKKFDELIIIEIPFLYKLPTMEWNLEALRKLKGVIDELSIKN